MSLTAAASLARELTKLSVDLHRRPPGSDLSDLLRRAVQLERHVRAVRVPDLDCVWHLRIGEILFRYGRFADAATEAGAAASALQGELRKGDLEVAALALKARCLDRMQAWAELDGVAAAGIDLVEQYRYSLSAPYLRSAYMRSRVDLYTLGVRAAWKRGDHAALVRRAELAKCRSIAAIHAAGQNNAEEAKLAAALRAITERITSAENGGAVPDELLLERRRLWDLFEAARRDGDWIEPDLVHIQGAINPGEAALYYFWVDRHTMLRVVLDRTNIAVDACDVPEAERAALDAFARELSSAENRVEKALPDRIDEFAALLWPRCEAARQVLEAADRLIVSPHRQLHALPIGALSVDGGYMIQRWAVRFAPNLTCLLAGGRDGPRRQAALTMGVGHYTVPGKTFGDLPEAAAECADVGNVYREASWDVVELVDGAATPQAITEGAHALPSVAHIACHGKSVEADTPLESGIVLANGVLDGLDIALSGLAAETVVLSACCAGQRAIGGRNMAELPGDDLLGLQSGFFASGTREIVATLFPVEDRAARRISVAFHRRCVGGTPADIALAESVREFIARAGPLSRRRYCWAPFFLSAVGPNAPAQQERATLTGNPRGG